MPASDFIITRKRKKYKFARFAELPQCYEADEFSKDVLEFYAKQSQIVVELGAGTGSFLVEQARNNPESFFVAVDVKADRLYAGARVADELRLTNIVFVRAHAEQLVDIFPERSVAVLWLTFSDPFPKKRHTKHRMTHPKFLQIYRKILSKSGVMHFKTDNHALFDWSLEQFVGKELTLRRLSYDLHNSDLPEQYKIMTTYEKRFVGEGLPIYSVDVIFGSRACDEPSRQ